MPYQNVNKILYGVTFWRLLSLLLTRCLTDGQDDKLMLYVSLPLLFIYLLFHKLFTWVMCYQGLFILMNGQDRLRYGSTKDKEMGRMQKVCRMME